MLINSDDIFPLLLLLTIFIIFAAVVSDLNGAYLVKNKLIKKISFIDSKLIKIVTKIIFYKLPAANPHI